MHKLYGGKGLKVLAVSTEDAPTVKSFLSENHYTFPAFLDAGGKASTTYNVDGIPCLVILDAKGNLASYMVGLHPEAKILAGLKKAGLKT
jgi:peroxiredoxin